jgi:hypothetical protein
MSPKGRKTKKTITSIYQQLFAHSTHTVFLNVKHSQARESGFKLQRNREIPGLPLRGFLILILTASAFACREES